MGGNALKNTVVRRMEKDEFDRISGELVAKLRRAFPLIMAEIVKAYEDKTDFGDIDVVISREGVPGPDLYEALKTFAFKDCYATEAFHQKNSNCVSFDWRDSPDQTEPGVQVDLITCRSADFNSTTKYLAFNDLGNLIGRIAHKQDLSFGDLGLLYHYRVGNYLFRTIVVTKDFDVALRYLGYDPARYHQGFKALEDVFEYAASSPYFNPDIFLLENRNHKSRTRDRKRKTYTAFLRWCADRPGLTRYSFPENKDEWLPRLCTVFPHMAYELDRARRDLELRTKLHARFNGTLVGNLTGLSGKKLGEFMQAFRSQWSDEREFERFVFDSSDESLADAIKLGLKDFEVDSRGTPYDQ
jgi:hypothetical protein